MISGNLSAIFYLISGILFILALRGLSSPDTKTRKLLWTRNDNRNCSYLSIGNFSTSLAFVIIFLIIGGTIGAFIAFKIPMTAMSLVQVFIAW